MSLQKENIILVQAVDDALSYPTHFDVGFPKHSPSDPIPAYYSVWKNAPKDQLTILDAPNFPDSPDTSGNWDFEDCAVCRTQASDGSITDQVLGCVTFRFHRKSQKEAELPGNGGAMASQAPGKLWNAALKNWQK